jgi:hypothetical protein
MPDVSSEREVLPARRMAVPEISGTAPSSRPIKAVETDARRPKP